MHLTESKKNSKINLEETLWPQEIRVNFDLCNKIILKYKGNRTNISNKEMNIKILQSKVVTKTKSVKNKLTNKKLLKSIKNSGEQEVQILKKCLLPLA